MKNGKQTFFKFLSGTWVGQCLIVVLILAAAGWIIVEKNRSEELPICQPGQCDTGPDGAG